MAVGREDRGLEVPESPSRAASQFDPSLSEDVVVESVEPGKERPTDPLQVLREATGFESHEGVLVRRASGAFYTPRPIADHLVSVLIRLIATEESTIRVCDPFAGDGRLVAWLIETAHNAGLHRKWDVSLWDVHSTGLVEAGIRLEALSALGIKLKTRTWIGDAFGRIADGGETFDLVITNPPWENLKPDRRDLDLLPASARAEYRRALKETAAHLESLFPHAAPSAKYGGWGTNLSRVGTEAALRVTRLGGVLAIVLPVSLLADQVSSGLRRWLLSESSLLDIGYFPAEGRPFSPADVGACTLVVRKEPPVRIRPQVSIFDKALSKAETGTFPMKKDLLPLWNHSIPIGFGLSAAEFVTSLSGLPTFGNLESSSLTGLWAGREIDETKINDHLTDRDGPLFVKGRMIQRFEIVEEPSKCVRKTGWQQPPSVAFERLVWRDVSRPSQKRRIIATIVPPGLVAGNSLGVAHFRDADTRKLRVLLGLVSSLVFEAQLRALLATGHVSLASLRMVRLPWPESGDSWGERLSALVERRLIGEVDVEAEIEALVATAYGLALETTERILRCFPRVTEEERTRILEMFGPDGVLTA